MTVLAPDGRVWDQHSDGVWRIRRYHQDCAQCCALGRCHWCLVSIGSVLITGDQRGLSYHACPPHAAVLEASFLGGDLTPDPRAFPAGIPPAIARETYTPLALMHT